ncbi:reverse transcriptase domain-containing protein [Tanacetum coccineum]
MIKEHDQQAKMKTTPRKLAYADSDKEAPARSLAKGFSDRFCLESSGISDTHIQTRSTSKSQKTPSKKNEPTHLRRLEDRSTTNEKARRERRAKLPRNIRVYEGKKDLEDHLGGAARNWFDDLDPKSMDSFEELSQKFLEEISQQKRYAKDPTEIHGIKRRQNEGLQAFMDRFKSENSHIKGAPPVLRISTFMHGHGHSELAKKLNDKIPKTVDDMFERVRAFIRGEVAAGSGEMVRPSQRDKGYVRLAWSGVPEKARNRGGPREARRNMWVCTPYPINDTFTLLIKTPKEILAMESVSFPEPPPLIGTPEKIREQVILKGRSNSGRRPSLGPVSLEKARSKEDIEEVFTIHERPDQYVTMGTALPTNCKQLLADILRENIEVFVWTGSESTIVPRFVMEYQLKIYPLAEPVVHKRRPVSPEGRLSLKERVFHWLGEGLIRKVRHPEWITNTIPIKLENGTWKVQMDYSSLNKACSKDMYPFSEEGEELASLMGYPYKCFLRLSKEYNQLRMAEDDEEKIRFHTEEGVYYFTHMPKELKNFAATLQRMMEKDVKETLGKLKRVNIKIDPIMSSFRVKEGKFLGHMITEEGLRADPERIQAIILSPTPKKSKSNMKLIPTTNSP